jgi:FkbM family methyltransferase
VATNEITILDRALRQIGHTGLPGIRRAIRFFAPPPTSTRRFEAKFFNMIYAGDLAELIDYSIFYFGAYSPGELAFLARSAEIMARRRGAVTFYDVGANTGQHSLFMSGRVAAVHAFEPSIRLTKAFAKNLMINDIRNVHIHPVALSDGDANGDLGSGFPGNSGSRSLNWTLPGHVTEKVVVKDACTYFQTHSLDRVDILKIDVEGHESRVLRGLSGRLISDRPIILMELIGEGAKGGFASCEEFRASLYPEFELRSLREKSGCYRLTEFDWYHECAVVLPREMISEFAE